MPMRPPPAEPKALSLPNSLLDRYEEAGEPPYFVVRSADGEVVHANPPEVADDVPPDPEVGRWIRVALAQSRHAARSDATWSGAHDHPGRPADSPRAGRPAADGVAARAHRPWRVSRPACSVGGGCRRAVRPIVAMSETVSGINASSLSRRLDLEGVDTELGRLGVLINTMLERLGRSFEQQARFTADASHELRTPLAVILSQVELALSRPREGPAYRESLEACGRAALRMKSLVDDLLTLARADSGKLELRVEPIDLARIAEESVALLEPLAQKRRSASVLKTSPAPLKGDPERLGQVLTNLLSNAIQYNQPGGQVIVSVRNDDGLGDRRRRRHGRGNPRERSAARVRPVPSGRRREVARVGRQRARPGDLPEHRPCPRRHNHRGEHRRPRFHVYRDHPSLAQQRRLGFLSKKPDPEAAVRKIY